MGKIRAVAIVILVMVIAGTLGTGLYLYRVRQQGDAWRDMMHLAEAMMKSGEHENALVQLKPVVEAGKKFEAADHALYLMARLQQEKGMKEAYPYWEQLVNEYPQSKYFTEARLHQADALMEVNVEQALRLFEELSRNPDAGVKSQALFGIAKTLEVQNQPEEARKRYSDLLDSDAPLDIIAKAKDQLSKINSARLWSPVLDDYTELYEVQRGDSPAKIGQKFKTTAWFVSEANQLSGPLRPGRRVKVPKEPFRIEVDKSNCRLNLLTASGRFVKWYPVGIGEQSYKTPVGEYTIKNMQIDPVWFKPTGGILQPGNPENALGSRWMGIGSSLGIHGTNAPETIGYRKSAGCIRMFNQDVEELYKFVTIGSRVTIVEPSPAVEGSSPPIIPMVQPATPVVQPTTTEAEPANLTADATS